MGRNHYGITTGKAFRLSVCLKRFFSDERARCYVTVDSGLCFRWLAARMRRLFALSGPFCLLARGHLLPPDEPLGLLSPDDLVEVIPKHYKMFPDTSESDASDIENLFGSDDEKPKHTAPVLVPPGEAAKGDHHNPDETPDETDACQSSNTAIPELNHTASQGLQHQSVADLDFDDDIQSVEKRNFSTDNEKLEEVENEKLEAVKRKALELLDQCSIPPKRKRKRVRRRKPCTAIQQSEDNTGDTEDVHDRQERPPTSEHCTTDGNVVPERSPSSQHADTFILRNNTEHRRAARLVHSLS